MGKNAFIEMDPTKSLGQEVLIGLKLLETSDSWRMVPLNKIHANTQIDYKYERALAAKLRSRILQNVLKIYGRYAIPRSQKYGFGKLINS